MNLEKLIKNKIMTKKTQTINREAENLVNFSKNKKLNGVLNDIYTQLLEMCDTENESISEIKHYAKEFPKESDYNIAQYGNLIVYHDDMLAMYKKYGYVSLDRLSNDDRWNIYKRQVGYVVRYILGNNK